MKEHKLYILALKPGHTIPELLFSLRSHSITPLVRAKVLRWIILPVKQSSTPLLAHNTHWGLLLILDGSVTFPPAVDSQISASWTADCSFPSSMVDGYASRTADLMQAAKSSPVPSPGSSRMSTELCTWASRLPASARTHPIAMLNLLAFNQGRREQYAQYGKAFSAKVAPKYGSAPRLMGSVVGGEARDEGWDQALLVHYPSLYHFAAMAGDDEYLEINRMHRLGALRDTAILCVMEIDERGDPVGGERQPRL
ncbi:hypothetical protein FQN54_005859 [Arachnomyces sp. PD_36]|nr:hypothetical protein FQN54_005859 [Arachnomyces sp. PD_36]